MNCLHNDPQPVSIDSSRMALYLDLSSQRSGSFPPSFPAIAPRFTVGSRSPGYGTFKEAWFMNAHGQGFPSPGPRGSGAGQHGRSPTFSPGSNQARNPLSDAKLVYSDFHGKADSTRNGHACCTHSQSSNLPALAPQLSYAQVAEPFLVHSPQIALHVRLHHRSPR